MGTLFGAFTAKAVSGSGEQESRPVRSGSPDDVAILLNYARRVVIVPGYGLAVAQAQHTIREMADLLTAKGIDVAYGIHPVAGRMPGHMNVLLAEANVPYEQLVEMEDVNPTFAQTDVAAKAGEASVIAKAPTLANKLDDIVRYGEWALDDVEREVLNIPKGLRWQFGQDTPIFNPDTILGKASGYAAEAVGKPFSRVRAAIGDIPALNRVQGFVRPKSYGGALNALGRRAELDGVDILREVSRYSASIRSRAQRGLMEQTLLAENQALLKELETSPFRNTVYEVIQGTAAREGRAVPLEEFNLAQRITDQLFNGSRSKANEFIQQFNARRGVDAFEIGDVEDYFHGTLSDDAQRYVSGRKFGRGGWDSEISQTIDLSPRDFVAGPSVMRGKKLVAGEEWLGETLQFGDIAEINRIARDKLGFDWFKTDALSVTADYIDAVARQTGRVAFADRLFDYGTDVVDKILYKMVPDQELVSVAKQSYNSLNRAYNKIANSIDRLEASATATVGRVSGRAERDVARGAEAGAVLRSDIAGLESWD